MTECPHPECFRELIQEQRTCTAHAMWFRRQKRKHRNPKEQVQLERLPLILTTKQRVAYWTNCLLDQAQEIEKLGLDPEGSARRRQFLLRHRRKLP